MQEVADYLELANIQQTIDKGHAIVHIGESIAGVSFILINNWEGQSVLTEGL